VNISEMDVSLCNATGTKDAAFAAQQARYHDIVKACLDSAGCQAVTLWGVVDKYSWLNSFMQCPNASQSPWPLAFDDSYQKKPAYTGILNALLGK
jgi:endo-1,4-beta-xylanase